MVHLGEALWSRAKASRTREVAQPHSWSRCSAIPLTSKSILDDELLKPLMLLRIPIWEPEEPTEVKQEDDEEQEETGSIRILCNGLNSDMPPPTDYHLVIGIVLE